MAKARQGCNMLLLSDIPCCVGSLLCTISDLIALHRPMRQDQSYSMAMLPSLHATSQGAALMSAMKLEKPAEPHMLQGLLSLSMPLASVQGASGGWGITFG